MKQAFTFIVGYIPKQSLDISYTMDGMSEVYTKELKHRMPKLFIKWKAKRVIRKLNKSYKEAHKPQKEGK